MCRAIPSRVTRVESDVAWILDENGAEQAVSLISVPDVAAGDYVYHHAGLALQRLDATEAEEVIAAYAEMDALMDDEDDDPGAPGGGMSSWS